MHFKVHLDLVILIVRYVFLANSVTHAQYSVQPRTSVLVILRTLSFARCMSDELCSSAYFVDSHCTISNVATSGIHVVLSDIWVKDFLS